MAAYLDNNATTQPAPAVIEMMRQMLENDWANPSSMHRAGQTARHRVELARAAVARLVGCRDRELLFTGGGTEAINLALRGVLKARRGPDRRLLITTAAEHAAVRQTADALTGADIRRIDLPMDIDGRVDPTDLAAALDEHADDESIVLVSLQWANNETGVIQPIDRLAETVAEHRKRLTSRRAKLLLHVDATQAVGKLPIDLSSSNIDLASMAAHKFHGGKGIGALFVRSGVRPMAQITGGPQERERRGGTENTPGIVGMGVAAELAESFLRETGKRDRVASLRNRLERSLVSLVAGSEINGARLADTPRLWNTTNVGFCRLQSEAILLGLSERGVYASAGAACSSGSLEPSPVLLAMGVPEPIAFGSVRFSLSRDTTEAEIEKAIEAARHVVGRLASTMPNG